MPLGATQTVPVKPSPPNAQDVTLGITYVTQKPFKNLCWAACGAMIFQYYKIPNVSIGDIASKVLGLNCNLQPAPAACDTAVWPQNMYGAYDFSCQTAGAALSLQSVQAWIANMQPVQPYFQWSDDEGNHTVLIVGYYANGDLLIYDPLWGIGRQTYQFVLYAYGRGTWQDTWYNIRPLSNVPLA